MKRFPLVVCLTLSLMLSMCAVIPVSHQARALSATASSQANRDAADLHKKAASVTADDRVSVIIQPNGPWGGALDYALQQYGASDVKQFKNFNFRVAKLPAKAAAALALRRDVAYVSLDREIKTLGHVSLTTGADAVRVGAGTTTSGLDGTAIGIAVLDSGIDTTHKAFLDKSNTLRVVVSRDFTGENRTDDPYGHGTHVASIAAGNGRISNAQYLGIAPNANIINLRVLNSQGTGSTSALLQALDWILTNRTVYNIRVVNMSLGAPAVDSYRNDPVCKAVRNLVDSGVVVVAAAGNNGKDSNGNKVYGHIHSPGNEPSALTVGAANTFGTDSRADDTVTTYSSRGPTRSHSTDSNGVRHYDNLIKPDLVAPGNKLIDAEALNNQIIAQYPQLDAGVSPVDN
ncbi:MAG: S8 family serine peptidase, partial [Acidobacteriota bacterium]|nr:S8 family serine peptidase [Acidobacteriota bacterium]